MLDIVMARMNKIKKIPTRLNKQSMMLWVAIVFFQLNKMFGEILFRFEKRIILSLSVCHTTQGKNVILGRLMTKPNISSNSCRSNYSFLESDVPPIVFLLVGFVRRSGSLRGIMIYGYNPLFIRRMLFVQRTIDNWACGN